MKKVLIITIILIFALTTVIFAAPGDENDPIVVLSYLNNRLTNLIKEYDLDQISKMQEQIQELKSNKANTPKEENSSPTLEVVEIKKGESLIADAGTEFILRGGKATIIGSELGGIPDVTAGREFVSSMEVVAQHLYIVPRSDGRGVYAETDAILMVRGSYEIVK